MPERMVFCWNPRIVRQLYTAILMPAKPMKTKSKSLVLEVGVEPTCPVKGAGF